MILVKKKSCSVVEKNTLPDAAYDGWTSTISLKAQLVVLIHDTSTTPGPVHAFGGRLPINIFLSEISAYYSSIIPNSFSYLLFCQHNLSRPTPEF